MRFNITQTKKTSLSEESQRDRNNDDFSNITIKCHPSEMAELKEHYQAIGEPFNGDKRYWLSVQPNMDINDEELKELVRKSYETVKLKYKKHG